MKILEPDLQSFKHLILGHALSNTQYNDKKTSSCYQVRFQSCDIVTKSFMSDSHNSL